MKSCCRFFAFRLIAILSIAANTMGLAEEKRDAQIAKATDGIRDKLIEARRDLHEHPELSNREERTSRLVAERLRGLGIDEVKTDVAKHGVVALLKGGKPGPVVAY